MTKKILYFQCNSGISGDMTVAALLDLGASQTVLESVVNTIPVKGFKIEISRVKKAGLDVCDFNVVLDENIDNHDHDMEYLFGEKRGIHAERHDMHAERHDMHTERHDMHTERHNIHTDKHTHVHSHRNLAEVLDIIDRTDMTENARNISKKIFHILAVAEAKAHGVTDDEVHFHEVGAVDSIVDIIAAAVCIDNLSVSECVIPVLYEGCGTIRCAHGILPVPVPAVVNIAADNDLRLSITEVKGELVTPTGAAIAAALKTSDTLPDKFSIDKVGMGGGKREYERPSILRAMLITSEEKEEKDYIYKLETNIDDCSGEILGYVMKCLFDAGAADVNYSPVFMKKNRPAYQLNVICHEKDIDKIEKIIFKETTTIGIRKIKIERDILPRRLEIIDTQFGTAKIKICEIGGEYKVYPEYESVVEISEKSGKSYQEIYEMIKTLK